MTSNTKSLIKGMGAVMAVSGTAAILGTSMTKSATISKKKIKKTADKALKAMNGIIDSVSEMF